MTYRDLAAAAGREPFSYVEVDFDRCTNTYGVAPCTAVLPKPGGQCYKYFMGCQDTPNFNPAVRTFRFIEPRYATLPLPQAYPCLNEVKLSPTKIEPGKSMGRRASISVELQDFKLHDIGQDDNLADRVALASGGFLARLFARNRISVLNRPLRVVFGFLSDPTQTETRSYVIETIDGPDDRGLIRITAKDPLKFSDNDRSQAPVASPGKLATAIVLADATGDTFDVEPVGAGDAYPTPGVVRIEHEVFSYTRVGDTFTIVERGKDVLLNGYPILLSGSDDEKEHEIGAAVQWALVYEDQYIDEIVYDLLVNYAGVPASYIDTAAWDDEVQTFLPRLYNAALLQPYGVKQLLDELAAQAPFFIWWDERAAQIKLRVIRLPSASTPTVNDDDHIVAGSVKLDERLELRVSQVWVYYGQVDPTLELARSANFTKLLIGEDESANADGYGAESIKTVHTRFIGRGDDATALDLTQQILGRYKTAPREVSFDLDPKDGALWTGDIVYVKTRNLLDKTGTSVPILCQVIEADDKQPGRVSTYRALEYFFPSLSGEGFDEVHITTDQVDLNLRDFYETNVGAATATDKIRFVVDPGVDITSSDWAIPAMTTGDWSDVDGARLQLINLGFSQGAGGNAGAGTSIEWDPLDIGDNFYTVYPPGHANSNGPPPTRGGAAFEALYPIAVDNLEGKFWGGGGGGSGGDWSRTPTNSASVAGSAGGGGAGAVPGPGGTGGTKTDPAGTPTNYEDGDDGTATTGGDGGSTGFEGGAGGEPGEPGVRGDGGGMAPGAAGYAADGAGLIVFANLGNVRGPLRL